MRNTPHFVLDSDEEIRRLIRRHPWATIVSHTAAGLVASHYPVLLDERNEDEIVLLSHVGRPDEVALELGDRELLVIIQGPHGYISPSWYAPGAFVPTWNHATAHLWGTPELLSEDENLRTLGLLVDTFEQHVPDPRSIDIDLDLARRAAVGTVGFRLRVTRSDARTKYSQNKPSEVIDSVIAHLRSDGAYQNAALADEMSRHFAAARAREARQETSRDSSVPAAERESGREASAARRQAEGLAYTGGSCPTATRSPTRPSPQRSPTPWPPSARQATPPP